jgi:hypothetical protein
VSQSSSTEDPFPFICGASGPKPELVLGAPDQGASVGSRGTDIGSCPPPNNVPFSVAGSAGRSTNIL